MQPVMSLGFDYVHKQADRFQSGFYCAFSIKEQIYTPFHAHKKGQFIYIINGTMHIDTDDKHYFLPVEHFMWIPSGVGHRTWTNNLSFRMFTIYFDDFGEPPEFYKKIAVYRGNDLMRHMIEFSRQWNGHVRKKDSAPYKFLQGFKAILPQLTESGSLPLLGLIRPNNARLMELMQYLRDHVGEQLVLSRVALKFGFSVRSLNRLFKAEGTSFTEFLQAVRVVRSIELLADKKLNVNLVATQVGYESVTAFSNIFMRFTGVRPTHYLKKVNIVRKPASGLDILNV